MDAKDFQALGESDLFCFSCTQCGECCFDQVVLLEPLDLFLLSRGALEGVNSSTDLFSKGFVALELFDEEWRCSLTMPRFSRGSKCRFLSPVLSEVGKVLRWSCDLHLVGTKPLVCMLSPLARDLENSFYLVPPTPVCPGMKRGEPQTKGSYLRDLTKGVSFFLERMAFSIWFHRELRPKISAHKDLAMEVYDFDRGGRLGSLREVESYLQALIESSY